jgi:hypothetical protein
MDYQELLDRTADPSGRPTPVPPAWPEFAYPASIDVAANQRGMTLRDHFAGLALQAMLARGADITTRGRQYVCQEAYVLADLMLKAREGREL